MVLPNEGEPKNVSITQIKIKSLKISKNLKKVMFLVSVGLPLINHNTSKYFYGKLVCSPLLKR